MAALLLSVGALVPMSASASGPLSLAGSNFEIDNSANLTVEGGQGSLDWVGFDDQWKADQPSGTGDDSFGQGTKEDTPVPTVVAGSIPPNKSDLKSFSTYLETAPDGTKFLHMYWSRVQDPTGSTNMDFEFNQSKVLSGNGVTPVRTNGDLLIQYDLPNGGTKPELFLSKWRTTAADGACEASNSYPCWGARTNLTDARNATGSINTTAITAANGDGHGALSARTFGEASINFSHIVDQNTCTSFGSAYLKSRSSDSFTAATKDFVAPPRPASATAGTS